MIISSNLDMFSDNFLFQGQGLTGQIQMNITQWGECLEALKPGVRQNVVV
jgi:hypothetical protein